MPEEALGEHRALARRELTEQLTAAGVDLSGVTITDEIVTPRSKTCDNCQRPIESQNKRAKYCSDACRQKNYRERTRNRT